MSQPPSANPRAFPTFIVATNDDTRADARPFDVIESPRANTNDADSTAWVNDCLTECYND
ncbi:MAG: hypothetical protein HZC40_07615 [Chloroflexi bacterium]|nr:hypothetical protein [Chloroflexota bacterium]